MGLFKRDLGGKSQRLIDLWDMDIREVFKDLKRKDYQRVLIGVKLEQS